MLTPQQQPELSDDDQFPFLGSIAPIPASGPASGPALASAASLAAISCQLPQSTEDPDKHAGTSSSRQVMTHASTDSGNHEIEESQFGLQ